MRLKNVFKFRILAPQFYWRWELVGSRNHTHRGHLRCYRSPIPAFQISKNMKIMFVYDVSTFCVTWKRQKMVVLSDYICQLFCWPAMMINIFRLLYDTRFQNPRYIPSGLYRHENLPVNAIGKLPSFERI